MKKWAQQLIDEKAMLNAARKKWLEEICSSGMNGAQICKAVGLSRGSFCRLCNDHDIVVPGGQARSLTSAYMTDAIKRGLTFLDIAEETGLHITSVHRAGRRYNIPSDTKRGEKRRARTPKAAPPKLTALEQSALDTRKAVKRRWG